jgi:transposase
MLKLEEFFMIRDIAHEVELEKGWKNISEISRRSGYNRRTVRKYLNPENIPISRKRGIRGSKLDPYKEYITKRLDEYPNISAKRLLREIKEQGYNGGYTILKDHLCSVRGSITPTAVYRYETKPGHQAQVDWGDCGKVFLDGEERNLYCFSMILGYSRMRYAEYTLSQDVNTLIQCHINAFNFFGGVPEEILYDNMKTVIIKKAFLSKDSIWNQVFSDFSRHYGFVVRTCRPYTPKTKGKIENTIGYIERDFFKGSTFNSFDDINIKLLLWLNRVNREVHGTTNEIPAEKVVEEKLREINRITQYQVTITETRKISLDSYISYLGNKYSVPYEYAGRTVTLSIKDGYFNVLNNVTEICTHEILTGRGRRIRVKEHFKGLLSETMKQNNSRIAKNSSVLHFKDLEVEQRPVDFYEQFSGGMS